MQPNSLKISRPGTAKYCVDAWQLAIAHRQAGSVGMLVDYALIFKYLHTYVYNCIYIIIYIYTHFFVYTQNYLSDPADFEAFGPLSAKIFHLPLQTTFQLPVFNISRGSPRVSNLVKMFQLLDFLMQPSNINPTTKSPPISHLL